MLCLVALQVAPRPVVVQGSRPQLDLEFAGELIILHVGDGRAGEARSQLLDIVEGVPSLMYAGGHAEAVRQVHGRHSVLVS